FADKWTPKSPASVKKTPLRPKRRARTCHPKRCTEFRRGGMGRAMSTVWAREGLPTDDLLRKLASPILAAAELAELGVSVSLVEPEGARRIYVSEAAARLLGYPRHELVGTSTFFTFAPEELGRMQAFARKWRNGEPIPHFLETVILRKDQSRVPIEIAYATVDLDGNVATVAFLRDISARKQSEEALRKSE